MTVPEPSSNDPSPAQTSLWPAIKHALHSVFLRSGWIIPLILICGGIVALAHFLAEAKGSTTTGLGRQLARTLLLLLPGLFLLLIRTRGWKRILTATLIFVPAAIAWLLHDSHHVVAGAIVGETGGVPVPGAYAVHRYLVAAALLSPLFILALAPWATIIDRYLLREFSVPFLLSLVAFFSIWLVFDLNDHLSDFREHRPRWGEIIEFYTVQIPHILTKTSEAAVLIATVYALTRLSRSNELTAILASGRSMGRTLLPLFLAGVYISFLHLVFNYQMAPQGEGTKEFLLDQFSGDLKTAMATKHLYVNERDRRTWFIGEIPFRLESEELRYVDIQEQDSQNRRTRAIQAASATWDSQRRLWVFYRAWVTQFQTDGTAPRSVFQLWHYEPGWVETPWQLVNRRMEPDYLGVPDLLSYLKTSQRDGLPNPSPFLTNFHHRWAEPWGCFTILFIAAPLGMVFPRRGILGGVASAIFLFGAILFLTELFLALGKSGYLPPLTAAWLTNLIFLLLGGIFLYLRARNQSVRVPRLRARRARTTLLKTNT